MLAILSGFSIIFENNVTKVSRHHPFLLLIIIIIIIIIKNNIIIIIRTFPECFAPEKFQCKIT